MSTSTGTLPLPPLPLFRSLLDAAASDPTKPALIDPPSLGGTETTYPQLIHKILHVRDTLFSHGMEYGDRIAFLIPPGAGYVATLLGIWAAGGVAVPLGEKAGREDVRYVVEDSGARWFVPGKGFEGIFTPPPTAANTSIITEEELVGTTTFTTPSPPLPTQEDPETTLETCLSAPALLIYTSGTTSRPKGVVSTFRGLDTQITALRNAWRYVAGDKLLHLLPLNHVHGIVPCLLVPLSVGGTVEFFGAFNPVGVVRRIVRSHEKMVSTGSSDVTLLMGVPTIWAKILQAIEGSKEGKEREEAGAAFAGLRVCVSGSAALPHSVSSEWRRLVPGALPLLERYGMTETGLVLSCGLEREMRCEGMVGWPMEGYEVALLPQKEDDAGEEKWEAVEGGGGGDEKRVIGELLVRGPGVFERYFNRPEEFTRKEFLAEGEVGEGSWFRTGDIAALCPSPSRPPSPPASSTPTSQTPTPIPPPQYKILGRISTDILKSGGYKLSLLELEHHLSLSPRIRDVAHEFFIVGVKDEVYGDVVGCVLVLKDGGEEVGEREWEGIVKGWLGGGWRGIWFRGGIGL
ncbi:hypothetical protein DFH27DRAFT_483332 [Peziza echinospora]|nr:hypothetical protein DFH27DRAFT_483332 [Peziza echinospora]